MRKHRTATTKRQEKDNLFRFNLVYIQKNYNLTAEKTLLIDELFFCWIYIKSIRTTIQAARDTLGRPDGTKERRENYYAIIAGKCTEGKTASLASLLLTPMLCCALISTTDGIRNGSVNVDKTKHDASVRATIPVQAIFDMETNSVGGDTQSHPRAQSTCKLHTFTARCLPPRYK